MATEKIRIKYEVDKKQLDASNKSLAKTAKGNDLVQKEVDQTNAKFKKQEKQLAKTNKAFAGLGGRLTAIGNRLQIGGKGAGDMAAGLFKTTKATTATSKAMKVLKFAIASTGIGLLVIALGSLVAFFTKTQRGSDLLSKAMAGIGAVVDVLIDRLSAFGEKIFKTFSDPKKAIKDLGNFIIDNIVNRFKAVIDLVRIAGDGFQALANRDMEALKQAASDAGQALIQLTTGLDVEQQAAIADSFSGITEEINREAKASINLEARRHKLREAENAFIETRAKLRREIGKSRLAVEEEQRAGETLAESNARRFKAAQDGIDAQNKLSNIEISLGREKLAILDEQLALGENLDEDNKALFVQKAALIDLDTQRDETLKRLITRQNAFNEAAKEPGKIAEKDAKKDAEILESKKQAISDLEAFTLESEGRLEEAELERRERLLENEELIEEERQLIIAESEAVITKIKADAEVEKLDIALKAAEDQKEIDDTLLANKTDAENQGLALAKSVAGKDTALAKGVALAGIFIDTKRAVTKAVALSPLTFGQPFAGFAIAQGIINAAAVAGILPKFEKGGRIGGDYHWQRSGGTPIMGEKDEFMMSRKATSKYGFEFMDKINNLELNDLTTGGDGASINIIDTNPIAEQLKNMPQTILNVDGDGFALHQRRGQHMISQKIERYST